MISAARSPAYAVNLGAPSAPQTALALRQAIWRKPDPAWTVCGLPEVLYSDHGSDFKSRHLEQVSADLRIQLINSTAGVPQGRGKIERLFGTITTELLPALPGYLPSRGSGPASPPRLSLAELDASLGRWISGAYHARPHSETKLAPLQRWAAGGWLPRLPESLEQLDRRPRRRYPHHHRRLSLPRPHRGYAATARTDAHAPPAR